MMTIQTAKLTAMKMVIKVPKGAGQHSGPHGVARVPEKTFQNISKQCDWIFPEKSPELPPHTNLSNL